MWIKYLNKIIFSDKKKKARNQFWNKGWWNKVWIIQSNGRCILTIGHLVCLNFALFDRNVSIFCLLLKIQKQLFQFKCIFNLILINIKLLILIVLKLKKKNYIIILLFYCFYKRKLIFEFIGPDIRSLCRLSTVCKKLSNEMDEKFWQVWKKKHE